MSTKAIVLDANILVRAVLGTRVQGLLRAHSGAVAFFAPDVAYVEARKYLPALLKKRRAPIGSEAATLAYLETIVRPVPFGVYRRFRHPALERVAIRDANDLPVLACAMALGCPVWTEDADFFGSGVATWTTDRVELYLR